MKLTKGFIDREAVAPNNKDQIFYRDGELKGFALRVTSTGVKSFVVETQIGNKVRRMTIGRYGKVTAEQARTEAKKLLGKIASGVDPVAEQKQARANLAMRVLRALFNFAMTQYEDTQGRSLTADNPVKRLSQSRAWYRVERRQSYIKPHELALWYEGIKKLENDILRDYLVLLLFTGLRRQEGAQLKWNQVDFKRKTLTITDTKNHESHTPPLSDYLADLPHRRKSIATTEFVFPGGGIGSYIVEPRKQMQKVTQVSGISFIIHDLRRTFITVAEGLDVSAYAVKRLANHKMKQDITSDYIITDVERLRKPMQQITDYLLKCMGVEKSADIVDMSTFNKGERYGN